jgi:hypothetical protein
VGVELTLDPTIRYQTILGFGGAFTDAAGETFMQKMFANLAKMPRRINN